MTAGLSLVIGAYEMRRELPRTVRSLSPAMQDGVDAGDYELIVVDNGSTEPPDRAACEAFGARIRWLRIDDASPSPASAINRGIAEASAPLVGVMVDGARLASPGLLRHALLASELHPRSLIATLGFHLGPDVQSRSVAAGYDEAAEDVLLEEADWTADGYRLFEISSPAGSSRRGWFEPPAESNALFMGAGMWDELGGFDEGFSSPGGGFLNLDLFERACGLADARLVVLLGEATFHQIHGGVATNGPASQQREFAAEYERLRGREFRRPEVRPLYVGAPAPAALATIAASAREGGLAGGPNRTVRRYVGLLKRTLVRDPALERAGRGPLDNLDRCVSTVISEHVPGDVVECGSGRGGRSILARGVLAAWNVSNRTVWLVDPVEAGQRVSPHFERYDLLDDQVRFLGASFGDALAEAPIERIAVLRVDQALGEATMASLSALYDRLSPGGFVIVPAAQRDAVEEFRSEREPDGEPPTEAGSEIRWRKPA